MVTEKKEMITDKDAKEFHKMIKKLEEKNKFEKEQQELNESYQQSKRNKKERIFGENQDDVKHDHVNKDRANIKDKDNDKTNN
tara:strand:+ start:96 stop:344 length:249 start_codon:yes stop_codon:yes gene_type:complete